jgi:hypothetical protein
MPKQHFFYRKNGCLKKINIDDILYLVADNNYTTFQEMNTYHYVRITLDAALSLLPENKFQRIHRSYAVSLDHIDLVKRDTVTFRSIDDLELPVSRQFYVQFTKQVVILDAAATDQPEKPVKKQPAKHLGNGHEQVRPAKNHKAAKSLKPKG